MRVILIIISLVFSFFAIAINAQEVKIFKDWQVKCDNYQDCAAVISLTSDRTIGADYTLSIARSAYNEFWEISLITYDAQPDLGSDIKFFTDENEIIFLAVKEFAAYDKLNQYYFLGDKAQIMFDEMMPANNAEIIFKDIEGKTKELNFSLNGLSASLLYIEDRQNRVGEKRSIGDVPRNGVLVTSREPHRLDDGLIELQVLANGCEPLEDLVHGGDVMSFRLDADTSLHLIPCWAGAYNFGYTAYKQDEYSVEQLLFANYLENIGWTGTKYLVNPYFNERYNRLRDFYKGRGIGDCGSAGLWQWDKYYFSLLKYEYKEECNTDFENNDEVELGVFPIIFLNKNYDLSGEE